MRSITSLVFIGFLITAPASAAIRRICEVYYETDYGWSDGYKMEVTFMTGHELNKATRAYNYSSYEKYALLWFDKDQVAILKIDDFILGVGDEFTAKDFRNAFNILSEKDATQINSDNPRKWKIEAKENFNWIDPRLQ